MITIYAEKPDMGTKIAAALDGIHLDNGKTVSFDELKKYDKVIKFQRQRDGYFKITYNGKPCNVTWGYGHMCGLKQAYDYNEEYKNWGNLPLPYIPDSYELKLTGPSKQYNIIKKLFTKSDLIINATDDDREGDLIFAYLYKYMKCKVPFKRALFNKQSQAEFIKAFSDKQLVTSNERQGVIDAGKARSAGDFIVGAGPTAAMSLKYPGNGILSVGRVQIAVLNLIVQRQLDINNFKPEDYWTIKGRFATDKDEVYIGRHETKKFPNKSQANSVLAKLKEDGRQGVINSVTEKTYSKSRPFLYNLASLQMDADKSFGLSPEQTLNIAQSLYEKGYTTYPRGDSVHLTNDAVDEMNSVISNLLNTSKYSKYKPNAKDKVDGKDKHYFDSGKVDGHSAIVPTQVEATSMSKDEEKIYDLIVKQTLCMVFDNATMKSVQIKTVAANETFITSGSSVVDKGYLEVLGVPKDAILPNVKEGDIVNCQYLLEEKQTEPPKLYTYASLLNAMMNCGKSIEDEELRKLMANGPGGKPRGLGRPSSRASIISTLEQREYTSKKGKSIIPTKKGMAMILSFPVDDLKSAEMTASWEKRLDDIEKGIDSYDSFMNDLESSVKNWTNQIVSAPISQDLLISDDSGYVCPVCGRSLKRFDWGYGCTGHQSDSCNFGFSKVIAGKKLSEKDIKDLLTKGQTKTISGFTSKNKKKFSASLKINKEKQCLEFSFDAPVLDDSLKCPICGKPLNKTQWGYGCSGYKETGCKFMIGSVASKKLTDKQIKDLLSGKTVFVKGMKSKAGKKFDANLTMDDKGKISFSFK